MKPCHRRVSLLSPTRDVLAEGATPWPTPGPRGALTFVLDVLLQEGPGVTQHPLRSGVYQFVMGHTLGVF